MPSLFRRKPSDVIEPEAADTPVEPERPQPRGYTPKKGEATPKRPAARRIIEPPPANRKEALARARVKDRESRRQQREGAMNGDERYLLKRDKGPVRALVRDVVDSRFNVGSMFFFAVILLMIGTLRSMPVSVQLGSFYLFIFLALALVVDSALLGRRVKRFVRERHPEYNEGWGGLYWYAIMRAMSWRRLRMPKPRIKPGQPF